MADVCFSKQEVIISQPWIKTKFCLQINSEFRKSVRTLNTKPEVVLRHRGCHLEIVYYVITTPRMAQFRRNSVVLLDAEKRADYCYLIKIANGKRIGGRLFFQTGSSYISAVDSDMWTKFGLRINCDIRKRAPSSNTKPEIVLRRRGCHLELGMMSYLLCG